MQYATKNLVNVGKTIFARTYFVYEKHFTISQKGVNRILYQNHTVRECVPRGTSLPTPFQNTLMCLLLFIVVRTHKATVLKVNVNDEFDILSNGHLYTDSNKYLTQSVNKNIPGLVGIFTR